MQIIFKEYAPVVLFTYNRPVHTKRVIEALMQNIYACDTDLYVYSDAARNDSAIKGVMTTREYLKTVTGFRSVTIVERDFNYGLAKNIIEGVTEICNRFGRVIVLEDDHVTSPYFLKYMNEGLEIYSENLNVASIHGYMYPHKKQLPEVFFVKGADCWSWATWKRAWDLFNPDGTYLLEQLETKGYTREFDFDYSVGYTHMLRNQIAGKNQSWAIRWSASMFLHNMYTLYPNVSLTQMIGADGSGTHNNAGDSSRKYLVDLGQRPIDFSNRPKEVAMTLDTRNVFRDFFLSVQPIRVRLVWYICHILRIPGSYLDLTTKVKNIFN